MKRNEVCELKPFLSVLIIIFTLFVMMFFKMELRRTGYSVFAATRQYKVLRDRHRSLVMEYAQITRPDRVKKLAISKFTLNDARVGQIIQMMGRQIALPQ